MELQAVKAQVCHAVDNLLHLGERVEIAHDIYHHAAYGIVGPVFDDSLGHSRRIRLEQTFRSAARHCQRGTRGAFDLYAGGGYRQPENSGLSALTVFSDNILPSRHFFCDVILTFSATAPYRTARELRLRAEGPR